MGKALVFFLFFLLISLISPVEAYAQIKASGSSAKLASPEAKIAVDNRVKLLRAYLKSWNSPLAASAETFIKTADKNNLDWRLVASIAGLESGFGKHIPYNSYNAWGWGVYGTNVHRFQSFDEGIIVISEGLRTRYMDQWGAYDVHSIGKYYAASPTWSVRVLYFMDKIEQFEAKKNVKTLSISI